jgi:hypothetical protein
MCVHLRTDRVGLVMALLMALAISCAATEIAPTAIAPTAILPAPTREAMGSGITEHLVSRRIDSPPAVDGHVDGVWAMAEPLQMQLTWGMDSTEHALDVELKALHTGRAVHFLAQWPGGPPSGEEDTVFNRFTLHWRIPEPEAQRLDCDVACHTAFADGSGRFTYANAETIPQGGSEALPVAGGWDDGTWTLEWSRPLLNSNPFDLQFADLDGAYTFLVKVFERVADRPDPISERHLLVFQP